MHCWIPCMPTSCRRDSAFHQASDTALQTCRLPVSSSDGSSPAASSCKAPQLHQPHLRASLAPNRRGPKIYSPRPAPRRASAPSQEPHTSPRSTRTPRIATPASSAYGHTGSARKPGWRPASGVQRAACQAAYWSGSLGSAALPNGSGTATRLAIRSSHAVHLETPRPVRRPQSPGYRRGQDFGFEEECFETPERVPRARVVGGAHRSAPICAHARGGDSAAGLRNRLADALRPVHPVARQREANGSAGVGWPSLGAAMAGARARSGGSQQGGGFWVAT